MEQRKISDADLNVSLVGLGCNNFGGRIDLETSKAVVHRALDLGVTLFDTADVYGGRGGSEEHLGQILGPNRKKIILATKFAMPMDESGDLSGASRGYIFKAVEASLKRLRTDWIDLYQIHRPDENTPIEETMLALDELITQGKVRHIGCSNFSAKQVSKANKVAEESGLSRFISCQDEYSLLERAIERLLLPTVSEQGMRLLPYFPLASGFLTGKYIHGESFPEHTRFAAWPGLAKRYMTDRNWYVVKELNNFCVKNNRSMLELAFSWLAANQVTASVIAGATSPSQVEQNCKAVSWRLSEGDLQEVDRITMRQED